MRHQVALKIQVSLETRENLAPPGHCEQSFIDVERLPETIMVASVLEATPAVIDTPCTTGLRTIIQP